MVVSPVTVTGVYTRLRQLLTAAALFHGNLRGPQKLQPTNKRKKLMQDRLPDKRPTPSSIQAGSSSPGAKPFLSRKGVAIFGTLAVVAILAAAYAYWRHTTLYPSTDNAQVQANIIQIAPLVTGVVSEVKVE